MALYFVGTPFDFEEIAYNLLGTEAEAVIDATLERQEKPNTVPDVFGVAVDEEQEAHLCYIFADEAGLYLGTAQEEYSFHNGADRMRPGDKFVTDQPTPVM
jgi:hypothetical protein